MMKIKEKLNSDFQKLLSVNPKVNWLTNFNPVSIKGESNMWENIKALTFDGASINELKTKVFAFIGFPKEASEQKRVPAMVLVHGGGGHAFAEWIKIWNDRGFAAIAMDTTGFFPSEAGKNIAGNENDKVEYWTHGLYGDFLEGGYTEAPDNDAMNSGNLPIEEQWMYHAVTDVILAHNILRSDKRINVSKIGLTGISWGGVISSIVMGYDHRFAFAIPVYGSGFLGEGLSNIQTSFRRPETKNLWIAENRFSNIMFPVLWLAWSNDPCFSIHANSLSYLATKNQGSVLSLQEDMNHSHYHGWKPEEIYRFAESIVFHKAGLTQCITEPDSEQNISFQIKMPSDTVNITAKVYYLTEKMTYSFKPDIDKDNLTIDQPWHKIPANVTDNTVTAQLPDEAVSFYVSMNAHTHQGSFITTSSYVEIRRN